MGQHKSKARRARTPAAPAAQTPNARSKRWKWGRRKGGGSPLRRLVYWSLVLALWALIAAVGTIAFAVSTLPPIQSLEVPKRPPTVEIVGLDGRPLTMRGEMSGTDVPIKELPPYLPRAFVAIEDRRFYSHFGVDPIGLLRAIAANVLRRGVSQGGSTITQQLAKNLFLTQERTLWRKMQELVLALWLERKFGKTQILELYLNRVYFGSGAYGVEAAAQRYFGKSARTVKVAEAAMLAGLVKSPSRLAPRPGRAHGHDRARLRHRDHGQDRARAARPRGQTRRRRLRQLRRGLDHGRARRSRGPRGAGPRGRDLDRPPPAGGGREGARRRARAQGPKVRRRPGRHRRDHARRRGARAGRRQELRGKSIQPRGRRQAPAGLRLQALRLFARARARAHARERARGQAGGAQGLEAGELQPRLSWAGDADAGARAVAQHGVGAAHPRSGAAGGRQDRLSPWHRLQARRQSVLGAGHVGSLAHRAHLRLCAVREWRQRHRAARGRARAHPWRQDPVRARAADPRAHRRPAPCGHDERHDARDAADRHRPEGATSGLAGRRQDRHEPRFPRCLVHRLYRPPRRRGVARQRRFLPDKKATGGGLPVDIWSRFMKVAHQGVAVAALPGLSAAPSFASALPSIAPPPPAGQVSGQAGGLAGAPSVRPQPIEPGLDGWFLDRLFGRR